MKNPLYHAGLRIAVVAIFGVTIFAARADGTNTSAVAHPVASSSDKVMAAQRLPYGVEDVLNLSRARISEEVIANYIRNSGTAYMLGPREIVYLRDEGVSDHVINLMVDQRKKVAEDNTQQVVQQATQQAAQQAIQAQNSAVPMPQGAPVVYSPNAVMPLPYPPLYDVPVEELPPPVSSLYVIPDPAVRAAYYGSSAYGISYYGAPYGVPAYGLGYPVCYRVGGSMVYHFGCRSGGSYGGRSHGGGIHVISHR